MTPKEIGQKYTEKTGLNFFNEFVNYFKSYENFTEWLVDRNLNPDDDEWYPEGELFEIDKLFGVNITNNEELCETFTDFFNELYENKW